MASTPRVLIFSPGLEGHRQVYCRVFTDILREAGCAVVVAGSFGVLDTDSRAALEDALQRRGLVELVDTCEWPRGGRDVDLAGLTALIREKGADATLLAEADDHLKVLVRQLAPGRRLPGRRVGVFLRGPRYVHVGRDPDPWRNRLGRWRRGRFTWDTDPYLILEHLVPRFGLLDAALCLDEVFVGAHGAPYEWLPDVYASFDPEDWALRDSDRAWLTRLHEFLARDPQAPVLVYYGTAHERRGYPVLLRLAAGLTARFVHCGARPALDDPRGELARLRETLSGRGALFETDTYLPGFGVAREFLRAAPCAVLPYRRHYVSSGVMLQALEAGRPVLVPDTGLMAWRTRSFGLGRTFSSESPGDLRDKTAALMARSPAEFEPSIERFMGFFGRERVRAAVLHALELRAEGAPTPYEALAAEVRPA
jgi:glycosyltransferase involved in cell wall biosynthesis